LEGLPTYLHTTISSSDVAAEAVVGAAISAMPLETSRAPTAAMTDAKRRTAVRRVPLTFLMITAPISLVRIRLFCPFLDFIADLSRLVIKRTIRAV
jgi:hypothetical protein